MYYPGNLEEPKSHSWKNFPSQGNKFGYIDKWQWEVPDVSTASTQEMFTRFTNIVNKAQGLGKEFNTEELIHKVFRSLMSDWDSKVIAIVDIQQVRRKS